MKSITLTVWDIFCGWSNTKQTKEKKVNQKIGLWVKSNLCCLVKPVNSCCNNLCAQHLTEALLESNKYHVLFSYVLVKGFKVPIPILDYSCPSCGKTGTFQ